MDANRSSAKVTRRVRMLRSCVGVIACHQWWWRAPFSSGDLASQVHPAAPRSQDLTEYCYTAIAEFASELDAATLARLGTWRRPYSDCWVPPSEATLRRTLQQVDADALDRLVGDWLADQQPPAQAGDQPAAVAVDGKALRGAVGPDGQQVHLLAALAHGSGTVLAQRRVDAKT